MDNNFTVLDFGLDLDKETQTQAIGGSNWGYCSNSFDCDDESNYGWCTNTFCA